MSVAVCVGAISAIKEWDAIAVCVGGWGREGWWWVRAWVGVGGGRVGGWAGGWATKLTACGLTPSFLRGAPTAARVGTQGRIGPILVGGNDQARAIPRQ